MKRKNSRIERKYRPRQHSGFFAPAPDSVFGQEGPPLNLVSSPGSGKTTLLVKTIEALRARVPIQVVEGDQQTTVDAERIRATGVPALQINTGKGFHLDGHMVGHALERLQPVDESLFLIENVGNLVCPAAFALGEHHKVVILSVTEGEDKPLKYPDMFRAATVLLLNKCDLLPYLTFNVEQALVNARRVNPAIIAIRVSATTGEGLPSWLAWLDAGLQAQRARRSESVAALKRRVAELEQHVGSLDNAASIGFLEETVTHPLAILDVRPQAIAHDLHPDYASTRLAVQLAAQWGVPAHAVVHHHAHIAAVCAEHGHDGNEPVLGLAMDGIGLGSDGGLWGGELLRVQGAHCDRLGHVQPLQLPGGERAAREPWRMAVSALHRAGQGARAAQWLAQRYPGSGYQATPLCAMLERGFNASFSSSLGRIFDAAAALLGLRAVAQYEG